MSEAEIKKHVLEMKVLGKMDSERAGGEKLLALWEIAFQLASLNERLERMRAKDD